MISCSIRFYRLCVGVNRSRTRDVPCRIICPSAHEYVLNRNSRNHGWEIGSASSSGKRSVNRSISPCVRICRDAKRPGCPVQLAREGVGNAGCQRTRSRACGVGNTRVSHHGYAETPGIPARNGFNGFLRALPGDRALLSPSATDHSANLTPASGRQDHTTSPSASEAPSSEASPTSTASRPAFVTIASAPLSGRDGENYEFDLGQRRSGKFFEMGLDR